MNNEDFKNYTLCGVNNITFNGDNNKIESTVSQVIMLSDEKRQEFLSTLNTALSKINVIKDECQKELACEYIEKLIDEITSNSIKKEKLKKKERFFESLERTYNMVFKPVIDIINIIKALM